MAVKDTVTNDEARSLMADVVELCRKRGLWVAHEDDHGGFIVRRRPSDQWLMNARGDDGSGGWVQ